MLEWGTVLHFSHGRNASLAQFWGRLSFFRHELEHVSKSQVSSPLDRDVATAIETTHWLSNTTIHRRTNETRASTSSQQQQDLVAPAQQQEELANATIITATTTATTPTPITTSTTTTTNNTTVHQQQQQDLTKTTGTTTHSPLQKKYAYTWSLEPLMKRDPLILDSSSTFLSLSIY
eukprot:scaffold4562_cov178-Amphora_coffeaeformis.AAC.8